MRVFTKFWQKILAKEKWQLSLFLMILPLNENLIEFMLRPLLLRLFHEGMEDLHRIVAIDETWVHCYKRELKRQSSEWRSMNIWWERPIKILQGASTLKKWWYLGTLHKRFWCDRIPSGASLSKKYCCGFLSRLRSAISRKPPNLLTRGLLILQMTVQHVPLQYL